MKECCKNCKHLRNLEYWTDYPNGRKDGWCCNVFNTKEKGYSLMQLYSIDKDWDICEVFSARVETE